MIENNNIIINENNNVTSKNQTLLQMLQLQKKGLPYKLRLDLDDIKRIVENINTSPFDNNECCIWNGYVTNNNEKCKYINFYFKNIKIALHRLLYLNYVDNLDNKNYLKFTCKNKVICCNINHIIKCNLTRTIKELSGNKIAIQRTSSLQVLKLDETTKDLSKKKNFIIVFD